MVNLTANATFGPACGGDSLPELLVEPGNLVGLGLLGCIFVLFLMAIHYLQPLAQAARAAHLAETGGEETRRQYDEERAKREREETAPRHSDRRGSWIEAVVLHKAVKMNLREWPWLLTFVRRLDCPWLEAEFEGDAFYNFVVTLVFETILNVTNAANTHLEGDLGECCLCVWDRKTRRALCSAALTPTPSASHLASLSRTHRV